MSIQYAQSQPDVRSGPFRSNKLSPISLPTQAPAAGQPRAALYRPSQAAGEYCSPSRAGLGGAALWTATQASWVAEPERCREEEPIPAQGITPWPPENPQLLPSSATGRKSLWKEPGFCSGQPSSYNTLPASQMLPLPTIQPHHPIRRLSPRSKKSPPGGQSLKGTPSEGRPACKNELPYPTAKHCCPLFR